MINLLNESFFRIVKSIETWIGIFLAIVFSIISVVQYIGDDKTYIDEWFFKGIFFVNLIAPTVLGLYFFKDFSNGTLRLKIATGNKKSYIFFDNFIVSAAYYSILTAINVIINLLLYKFTDIGTKGVNKEAAIMGITFMFLISISNAAITTFIGMLFQNVFCAVIPVVNNMIMSILAVFISNDENSPISKFITEAFPFGQVNYLSCISVPDRYVFMILYTFIVAAIFFFLGKFIFKRLNLK